MIGSLSDLGALLDWFRDADAALVALDLDLDTVTAPGHQTATTLITVAGWESELLSGRARGGLVEVENHDRTSGNAREDGARLVQRIEAMRGAGMSLQAIADQLNNEGVPPLRGTTWRVANVKSAVAKPATLTSVRHELPFIPREGQR
jgi:DNA invertase Pin-like site-specific DNA recombinase